VTGPWSAGWRRPAWAALALATEQASSPVSPLCSRPFFGPFAPVLRVVEAHRFWATIGRFRPLVGDWDEDDWRNVAGEDDDPDPI